MASKQKTQLGTASANWPALAWIFCALLLGFEYLVLVHVIPPIVSQRDSTWISKALVKHALGEIWADRSRQSGYMFFLVTSFPLLLGAALGIRARWNKRALSIPTIPIVIALQVLLGWAVIRCWDDQRAQWEFSFSESLTGMASLIAIFFTAGLIHWRKQIATVLDTPYLANSLPRSKSIQDFLLRLPILIAIFYATLGVLPSFFTDGNLPHAYPDGRGHNLVFMDEFAAVLNGRVPQVDFFPIYQHLLAFAFYPFFRVFGLTPGTFSLAMASLSWISSIAVFALLYAVTRRRWVALALYLPAMAFAWIPYYVKSASEGPEWFSERNYAYSFYLLYPNRGFGPLVLALLCYYSLRQGTRTWRLATFAFGALTAINNYDWGFPALVAALTAHLVFSAKAIIPSKKSTVAIMKDFFITTGGLWIAYNLLLIVMSGKLPDWRMSLVYQDVLGFSGFGSIPMQANGIHWLVFLTYGAAAAFSIFSLANSEGRPAEDRARHALLLYVSITSFGVTFYFINRAHTWNLMATGTFWGLALALLQWEMICVWKRASSGRTPKTVLPYIVPTFVLAYHYFLFASQITNLPGPAQQWNRFKIDQHQELAEVGTFHSDLIKKHSPPGSSVMLLIGQSPYSMAGAAGVKNYYPFIGFPLAFKQIDRIIGTIGSKDIRTFIGSPGEELQARLHEEKFEKTESVTLPTIALEKYGLLNLEVWKKSDAKTQ